MKQAKKIVPMLLLVLAIAGGMAMDSPGRVAAAECCADNLKKEFIPDGYRCWNIVCNPMAEYCCGTYQPGDPD